MLSCILNWSKYTQSNNSHIHSFTRSFVSSFISCLRSLPHNYTLVTMWTVLIIMKFWMWNLQSSSKNFHWITWYKYLRCKRANTFNILMQKKNPECNIAQLKCLYGDSINELFPQMPNSLWIYTFNNTHWICVRGNPIWIIEIITEKWTFLNSNNSMSKICY